MALNSGRLEGRESKIGTVSFVLSDLGLPSLQGDLLYSSPGVPSSVPFRIGQFCEDNGLIRVNLSSLTYTEVLRSLVASRFYLEMLQWFHGSEKFMLHESSMFI